MLLSCFSLANRGQLQSAIFSLYQTEYCMLRQLLLKSPQLIELKEEEEVLFPNIQKHNRETHYNKEKEGTSPFVYIDQQFCELHCEFQHLLGYEQDRIKFMTKIEVDETRCEVSRGRIQIAQQPIFSKNDVITFLLVFKWYINAAKNNNKIRKGSFITQKEASFHRIRYNKKRVDQQQLLHILFLLSQKVYIQDRYIDQFVNVIASKGDIHYKQLNCLTILIIGGEGKQRIGNMASTQAETNKYQHYSFENLSVNNSIVETQKNIGNLNHTNLFNHNRYPNLKLKHSRSSRYNDRSPILSICQRQNIDNQYCKNDMRFNLQRTKKYFSVVEYLTAVKEINIQMIIMHLGEDKNPLEGGIYFEVVQQVVTSWPKHNSYGLIFKLNKQKTMQEQLKRSIENYRIMMQMELQKTENLNPDQIYIVVNGLNDKITEEFLLSTQEYINQSDYDFYIKKLDREIGKLENEFLRNYAITKYEYCSRTIKRLQKQQFENPAQNYLLMKIIGKAELSQIDIGYNMYKKLIDGKLQQGFSQFQSKEFINRNSSRSSGNYNEDELNSIQNRIEICHAKKKNLYAAIKLGQEDGQQLRTILDLLKPPERGDSVKSQLPIL